MESNRQQVSFSLPLSEAVECLYEEMVIGISIPRVWEGDLVVEVVELMRFLLVLEPESV